MGYFIKKVVVFILVILVIAFALQSVISLKIKDKTISTHDTWHLVNNENNDVVFLGSSRCFAHFSPEYFHEKLGVKSVNLGFDGHSQLTAHILRLNYYLQNNEKPKVAILNFDPFILPGSDDAEKGTSKFNKNSFSRYAYWPSEQDKPLVDYFGFTFTEKYVPLYALLKYRKIYNCFFLAQTEFPTYDKHDEGWDTLFYPLNIDEAVKNYNVAAQYDAVKKRLLALKTLCDDKGIQLVCVQSPVYADIYRKDEFESTARMCRELNIPFFDTNVPSITKEAGNFYNSNHMNTNGVTAMTDYLAGDSSFVSYLR